MASGSFSRFSRFRILYPMEVVRWRGFVQQVQNPVSNVGGFGGVQQVQQVQNPVSNVGGFGGVGSLSRLRILYPM